MTIKTAESGDDTAVRTARQLDEAALLLENGDVYAAEALIMSMSPGDMTGAITVTESLTRPS
ncbi:hypothetical protein [Nocardia sp. NPDC004711]